jgi:hypothetical protein
MFQMGHRSGRSAENRDTDAAWLAVGVFFPELLTVVSAAAPMQTDTM